MRLITALALSGLIAMTSCVRHYRDNNEVGENFAIDSISSKELIPNKSYCMFPGNPDTTADNLQYKEFSELVKNELTRHGYKYVSELDKAGTAIYLAYGVGAPKTNIYTQTTPIYGVTGVSSSTTYGSVSSNGNFSATTMYMPTYGITGAITSTGSYSTYFKYLIIDAYDVDRSAGKIGLRQLFKTTVTNSNMSDDLRRYFPVMAMASAPYIGTNTGDKKHISFGETQFGAYLASSNLKFTGDVVIDSGSNLMWAKNANISMKYMDYESAKLYVSNLEYAGYKDWRLPTNEEFEYIARYGGSSPAYGLNELGFHDVQYDYYWTSSPSVDSKNAWIFGMHDAGKYEVKKTILYKRNRNYYVWPVRNKI